MAAAAACRHSPSGSEQPEASQRVITRAICYVTLHSKANTHGLVKTLHAPASLLLSPAAGRPPSPSPLGGRASTSYHTRGRGTAMPASTSAASSTAPACSRLASCQQGAMSCSPTGSSGPPSAPPPLPPLPLLLCVLGTTPTGTVSPGMPIKLAACGVCGAGQRMWWAAHKKEVQQPADETRRQGWRRAPRPRLHEPHQQRGRGQVCGRQGR